jgi:Fic-DOC domain mobile mystery protein B
VQTIAWARGRRLEAHDILSEPFVRQVHKRMFGDAWKWAGHYRTTNKNIGVDRAYIIEEIAKLIADARYWVDENSFAADETAVRLHHKLAWIHPFPNGNGRPRSPRRRPPHWDTRRHAVHMGRGTRER